MYGFGEDFNAASLKRLVGDQIGGTVKPIVSEDDITRVFSHVAAVNRRLVGQDGKLSVTLRPGVVAGDAWVYQPQNRYLGPVNNGRVDHLFGGIESGRKYSLLLEVRLPPDAPGGGCGGQLGDRRADRGAPGRGCGPAECRAGRGGGRCAAGGGHPCRAKVVQRHGRATGIVPGDGGSSRCWRTATRN